MRTSAFIIAAIATFTTVTAASAQSVRVYVGPAPYAYDDDYAIDRPYSSERRLYADEPRVELRPSGGCGTYHFWNGDFCEDARDR